MDPDQDSNNESEGGKKPSGRFASFCTVFLVGVSIVAVTGFIAYEIGFVGGERSVGPQGQLRGMFAIVGAIAVGIAQMVFLISLSWDYRRKPVGKTIARLLILILIQGYFFWDIGLVNGMLGGARNVAGVESEMRNLSVGIESYRIDYRAYPAAIPMADVVKDQDLLKKAGGESLTTLDPEVYSVYMGSEPHRDPLSPGGKFPYVYYGTETSWILLSTGRDGDYDIRLADIIESATPSAADRFQLVEYDPTNGAISSGDIWRTSP
jgi:hypothetical protein